MLKFLTLISYLSVFATPYTFAGFNKEAKIPVHFYELFSAIFIESAATLFIAKSGMQEEITDFENNNRDFNYLYRSLTDQGNQTLQQLKQKDLFLQGVEGEEMQYQLLNVHVNRYQQSLSEALVIALQETINAYPQEFALLKKNGPEEFQKVVFKMCELVLRDMGTFTIKGDWSTLFQYQPSYKVLGSLTKNTLISSFIEFSDRISTPSIKNVIEKILLQEKNTKNKNIINVFFTLSFISKISTSRLSVNQMHQQFISKQQVTASFSHYRPKPTETMVISASDNALKIPAYFESQFQEFFVYYFTKKLFREFFKDKRYIFTAKYSDINAEIKNRFNSGAISSQQFVVLFNSSLQYAYVETLVQMSLFNPKLTSDIFNTSPEQYFLAYYESALRVLKEFANELNGPSYAKKLNVKLLEGNSWPSPNKSMIKNVIGESRIGKILATQFPADVSNASIDNYSNEFKEVLVGLMLGSSIVFQNRNFIAFQPLSLLVRSPNFFELFSPDVNLNYNTLYTAIKDIPGFLEALHLEVEVDRSFKQYFSQFKLSDQKKFRCTGFFKDPI